MGLDSTKERAREEYEYGINQAKAAHGQVRHWINYCIQQLILIDFPLEHISAKICHDAPEISPSYIREICAAAGCTNAAFANIGDGEGDYEPEIAHGDDVISPPAAKNEPNPNLNSNQIFGQNVPVRTPKPDARPNTLSDAWKMAANACERMALFTEKYPPNIGESEAALAHAVVDFFEVIAPTPDLKWSKCLPDWYQIELDNVIHGKHAAGAINATITLDGKRRKITREQVGERYDVIFEHALAFVNSIPLLKMSIQHYRQEYTDPFIAMRKVTVSPKLSEQA